MRRRVSKPRLAQPQGHRRVGMSEAEVRLAQSAQRLPGYVANIALANALRRTWRPKGGRLP